MATKKRKHMSWRSWALAVRQEAADDPQSQAPVALAALVLMVVDEEAERLRRIARKPRGPRKVELRDKALTLWDEKCSAIPTGESLDRRKSRLGKIKAEICRELGGVIEPDRYNFRRNFNRWLQKR